jgi:Major Facilitator Superfamily
LVERSWDEASIGVIMSIATAAEIIAQTPAGALVDAIRAKRVLMAVAALAVTAVSLVLPWLTAFWTIAASQGIAHAASAVFGPAIAAVTLGAVGRQAFSKRIGRNESFNHAGNAFAALTAGASAYIWGPIVVFYLLAAMALGSLVSVLAIPANAIDYDLARGLDSSGRQGSTERQPSGLQVLMNCRPLLIFAVCAVLFHLANPAMLPLVGQKLALQDKNLGTSLMAAEQNGPGKGWRNDRRLSRFYRGSSRRRPRSHQGSLPHGGPRAQPASDVGEKEVQCVERTLHAHRSIIGGDLFNLFHDCLSICRRSIWMRSQLPAAMRTHQPRRTAFLALRIAPVGRASCPFPSKANFKILLCARNRRGIDQTHFQSAGGNGLLSRRRAAISTRRRRCR